MNRNTDHRIPKTLQPPDEWITEIRQQWTLTPFEDHITISQDLPHEYQVNTTELSFDLHFLNITQHQLCIMTAHLRNSSRVRKGV